MPRVAERCLSLWVCGWLGMIQWNFITHKEGFCSNLTMEGKHHRRWLETCQKCPGKLWITKSWPISQPVCTEWYSTATDVFESFRNKCLKIYELDPAHFLSAPKMAWQACLKKAEVKLKLLADANMLLMVGKVIRDGICHAVHRYANVNSRYMKGYNPSTESSYLMYWGGSNLYGLAMSQNLPVDGFELKTKKSRSLRNSCNTIMMTATKAVFFILSAVSSMWNWVTSM